MSAVYLLCANLVTIGFATWQSWDLRDVLWIYWAQSLIIGFFHFCKILSLEELPGRSKTHQDVTSVFLPVFFFVFSLPHFFFMRYLIEVRKPPLGAPAIGFAVCILIFFLNHLLSFYRYCQEEMYRTASLWKIWLIPFARILPMHLVVYLSASAVPSGDLLLEFLVLKTVADIIMHMGQHSNMKAKT